MLGLYARLVDSYQTSVQLWEARVAAGRQPSQPLTEVKSLVVINVFYLGFTLALYLYMKQRAAPFQCGLFKHILLTYNAICVALAGYVVWGIVAAHMSRPFAFVCNARAELGPGRDGGALFLSHVFWVFFAQKFWEFLDTWFFILRKSFRQVSTLHIFHHCSINVVVGLILPFDFGGDMFLPIALNAFVHVLMYGHYLVSALGLRTWWKPYLTSLQLTQFVLIATQSMLGLSRGDACGPPFFAKALMVAYMGSMVMLFANFFFQSYVLKKPSSFGDGVVKRVERIETRRVHVGRAVLSADGSAEVALPAAAASGEFFYQIMPLGAPMPQLHVAREPTAEDRTFAIAGGTPGMSVTWTVTELITLMGPPKPAPTPASCSNLECCPQPQWNPQGPGCCLFSEDTADKKAQ